MRNQESSDNPRKSRSRSPRSPRDPLSPRSRKLIKADIRQDYKLGIKLGVGTFGCVREAIHKETHEKFAVKILSKFNKRVDVGMVEAEIGILLQVNHPNVIRLEALYETTHHWFILTELVNGGELFSQLGKKGTFSECEAAKCISLVLSGLAYLHSLEIVHRDLKAENILCQIVGNEIVSLKIMDFGLSKILQEGGNLITACGTPLYIAPEVLKGDPYDEKVDVWAVGVLSYMLLTGYYPFYADDNAELFELIANGIYSFPNFLFEAISKYAVHFIRCCLTVDPDQRHSASRLLEHRWIKNMELLSKAPIREHGARFHSLNESLRKRELPPRPTKLAKSGPLATSLIFNEAEGSRIECVVEEWKEESEWQFLEEFGEVCTYSQGDTIVEDTSETKGVIYYYRIISGTVEGFVAKNGYPLKVALLRKEDGFHSSQMALTGVMDWSFSPVRYFATEHVEAVRIDWSLLVKHLRSNLKLAIHFFSHFAAFSSNLLTAAPRFMEMYASKYKVSLRTKSKHSKAAKIPKIKGLCILSEFSCTWKKSKEQVCKVQATTQGLVLTVHIFSFLRQKRLEFEKMKEVNKDASNDMLTIVLQEGQKIKTYTLVIHDQYDMNVSVIENLFKEYQVLHAKRQSFAGQSQNDAFGLQKSDLAIMHSIAEEKLYYKGQVIIKLGDLNQDLYFIQQGSCVAEFISPESDDVVVLGRILQHENFGEIGFLQKGCKATATVRATQDNTRILVLSGSLMREKMEESLEFSSRVYKELASTLQLRFFATITDYQIADSRLTYL